MNTTVTVNDDEYNYSTLSDTPAQHLNAIPLGALFLARLPLFYRIIYCSFIHMSYCAWILSTLVLPV